MIANPLNQPGPFMKFCGMTREKDIYAVNEARPLFCGFIINVPKSSRNLSLRDAKYLAGLLSEDIFPVGVFVNEPLSTIVQMCQGGVITTVQLHGDEDDDFVDAVRDEACPSLIIQAFKIRTPEDMQRARRSHADMILLDNGWGTGQRFDWSLVGEVGRPFMLAGGLSPDNVAEAIRELHPWAVDMSSGLETDGLKDEDKIAKAAEAVRSCVNDKENNHE